MPGDLAVVVPRTPVGAHCRTQVEHRRNRVAIRGRTPVAGLPHSPVLVLLHNLPGAPRHNRAVQKHQDRPSDPATAGPPVSIAQRLR
jgi:hypothetical protein